MFGLPIPASQYLPKLFIDAGDPSTVALADKMDSALTQLKEDVRLFRKTRRVEAAPRAFIDEFGYLVSAGLSTGDSYVSAVRKSYRATQAWANRGTWVDDVKIKIDAIAGGNSSLIGSASASNSDSIIVGGAELDTSNYWSTIGTNITGPGDLYFDTPTDDIIMGGEDDGTLNSIIGTDGIGDWGPDIMASPYFIGSGDPNLGSDIIGSGEEVQIPGNVYINVDNPFLTAVQIAQIVDAIATTSCPAYFKVYLCSLDNYGNPVVYSGGIIG